MRRSLAARLRYLRMLEGVPAVLVPPAVVLLVWRHDPVTAGWVVRLVPLFLLGFMLGQAAVYWHLKLLAVEHRGLLPGWFGPVYRGIRALDLALIALFPPLALVMTATGHASAADAAWGATLYALALLGYVNHYHLQVMHESSAEVARLRQRRRPRRPALRVDLDRHA
jgi:hypothetical protein